MVAAELMFNVWSLVGCGLNNVAHYVMTARCVQYAAALCSSAAVGQVLLLLWEMQPYVALIIKPGIGSR